MRGRRRVVLSFKLYIQNMFLLSFPVLDFLLSHFLFFNPCFFCVHGVEFCLPAHETTVTPKTENEF